MRPFNLSEALAGAKVCTRDGREVTQLVRFDVENCNRPVVGVVDDDIYKWDLKGSWGHSDAETILDLFMREEPEEIWEPTAELRWKDRTADYLPTVLQQKHICGSGTASDPIKVKWVDIPTVGEE